MGKRGPAKKPTKVKKLQGTYRADRAVANEWQPGGVPDCPDWLDERAKAEWARLSPLLIDAGLLTVPDLATFAAYCVAFSQFREATEQCAVHGAMEVDEKRGVVVRSGWAIQAEKARYDMVRYGKLFGLNPSSRSEVSANPRRDTDSVEAFLFGDGSAA